MDQFQQLALWAIIAVIAFVIVPANLWYWGLPKEERDRLDREF